MDSADAVVIGSGPNGMVAAIMLARAGWDVTVLERNAVAGGAITTEALTADGYLHDTASAFYGGLFAGPVLDDLGLGERVDWAHFDTPLGTLVDPQNGAWLHRDVEQTARDLGTDAQAWRDLWSWWERVGRRFFDLTTAPIGAIRPALRLARRTRIRGSIDLARTALQSVVAFAEERFGTEVGRALVACNATHADVPISSAASIVAPLFLLMAAQEVGMPIPVGGAARLVDAFLTLLDEHGGTVRTGDAVSRVVVERGRVVAVETEAGFSIRPRHAVLADTGPGQLFFKLVGEEHVPGRYLDGLRKFRYGTGMFKVDIALRGQMPWANEGARRAGVVHLTGGVGDIQRAQFEASTGLLPAAPSLIVGQQSIADPTRAPAGCHTLWIECHSPPHPIGDGADAYRVDGWGAARDPFFERILQRIEHFAPGFREQIVGTAVHTPADFEARNPNLVGGDVGGGSMALSQQLLFRPVPGWFRYGTPVKGLYLCSASTHPGGGVHGLPGRNAAKRVLRDSWKPSGIARTATGARRRPKR